MMATLVPPLSAPRRYCRVNLAQHVQQHPLH
jgi:hypothetical protein